MQGSHDMDKNKPWSQRKISDYSEVASLNPAFQYLSDSELAFVCSRLSVLHLNTGNRLFQKSKPAHACYVVVSGVIRLSMNSNDGHEFIVDMAGKGVLLGESIAFGWVEHTVDAHAQEDTVVLSIPSMALKTARNNPQFVQSIYLQLHARMSETVQSLEDIALYSLRRRLARLLMRMHSKSEVAASARLNRYNQHVLALMAGATRPRVNEHLQYFRQIGAIEIEYGTVRITRPQTLAHIATSADNYKQRSLEQPVSLACGLSL